MIPKLIFGDFDYNYKEITRNDIANVKNHQLKNALQFLKSFFGKKNNFTFITSGSTGKPKSITFTKSQLIQSAQKTIHFFKLTHNDVFFVCLDVNMVAGKLMLVRAALLNAKIILAEPSVNVLEHMNHHISFASFVPLQIHQIIESKNQLKKLKKINKILIGGAAIDNTLENKLCKNKINAWHTYGMTETLTHIALKKIGSDKYFKPLENVKIKSNNMGCLCVKTDITGEKWIDTNDIVKIYKNNSFKILGRNDNIINSGGYKILPEEVENIISNVFEKELKGLNFFVGSIPDKKLGNKCVLLIETTLQDFKLNFLKLITHIHKYKIPKQIICIKKFQYTKSGKVNRIATLQYYENQANEI